MQTTKSPLTFLTSVAILALPGFSFASTVLPKGESYFSTAFYHQSFDRFYAGSNLGGNPGGREIERQQFRISADFGIAERLAADVSIGYFDTSSATVGPFTIGSQDGLADTYAGIKYALTTIDQSSFNSAVRLGITIPGDYQTGQLSAPGDDAFGVDLKVMIGRNFGVMDVEAYAGYWAYEGAVPETLGVGVTFKTYLPHGIWLESGYHYFDADGNLDIGGPGFTPAKLPQVSEQGLRGEFAIGFGDTAKRYYRVSFSKVLDGRNIGREETIGISVSLPF